MSSITGNQIQIVHQQVQGYLCHDYFDVRLELVDHILANIDTIQQLDPDIHFYVALNYSIDSLGGRQGIREIERSKTYEMWRAYLFDHAKAFGRAFQFPQVVLSMLSFLIIYQLILSFEVSPLVIFLIGASLTGFVESIDKRWKKVEVDHYGSTITSYRIYSRSAWVSNTPLLLIMLLAQYWFPISWMSDIAADLLITCSLFVYCLFFTFRFYFLRKGIRADLKRYRQLNNDLINMTL